MPLIRSGLALALLCFPAVGYPAHAATPSLSLPGFTVVVPDAEGWNRVGIGEEVVRFERQDGEVLSSFEFKTAKLEGVLPEQAFLIATESSLEAEFSENELLSRHYNYAHRDGAPCVEYDAILGLKLGEFKFMVLKGIECQLPSEPSRMARLEAARSSDVRVEAEEAAFLELADSVIGTVVFMKPGE